MCRYIIRDIECSSRSVSGFAACRPCVISYIILYHCHKSSWLWRKIVHQLQYFCQCKPFLTSYSCHSTSSDQRFTYGRLQTARNCSTLLGPNLTFQIYTSAIQFSYKVQNFKPMHPNSILTVNDLIILIIYHDQFDRQSQRRCLSRNLRRRR